MRNILLVPVALCFLLSACSKAPAFRMEGRVPDPVFEGSKVYLVALDAPLTGNVDSTCVSGGTFEFSIPADSSEVRILRIPARFPSIVEDLVVVCEPGTLTVVLDSVSRGSGTRLNNLLQKWKETKRANDSLQWIISMKLRQEAADKELTDSLKLESQKLYRAMLSESISLMNSNLFNGVGLLIYKLYYDTLPPEVRDYVTKMTGRLYLEKDAQLRQRFE